MNQALPPGVTRIQDLGGREALQVTGPGGVAVVSVHGAQVLAWHRGSGDVLWTASAAEHMPGVPVRGGVPLVFPWFGNHPTNPAFPAHGFARTLLWHVVEPQPTNTGGQIELEARDDASTRAMWPHAFRLRLRVAMSAALRLQLTVENTGEAGFSFEEALHTYFGVGDVHTASVHGLEGVPCTEHAAAPEAQWAADQPLHFRAETDRIFQGVPDRLELRAPALHRVITLTTGNARSAIVWNPWPAKTARLSQMVADDWQHFCCIESANVRGHAVALAPGASHTMSLTLACS